MWYQITEIPVVEGCVFKLWYAEKYVVIKCHKIARAIENINNGLVHFFKNTPKGRNPNDLYFLFYHHVSDNPFKNFKIEFILKSDNPYELLKSEQIALDAGKLDKNCLNRVFDAYVPQNTQVNGKKSWINRGYYLNFMEWKRNRPTISQNKTE